jgi:hypothetical protein
MGMNRWYWGVLVFCAISVSADNEFIREKPRKSKKKSVLKEELVNARKDLAYAYNQEITDIARAQDNNIKAIEAMIENTQSLSRADVRSMITHVKQDIADTHSRIQQLKTYKK